MEDMTVNQFVIYLRRQKINLDRLICEIENGMHPDKAIELISLEPEFLYWWIRDKVKIIEGTEFKEAQSSED